MLSLSSERFGEALRIVQDELDSKNFYAVNPDFLGGFKKIINKPKGISFWAYISYKNIHKKTQLSLVLFQKFALLKW